MMKRKSSALLLCLLLAGVAHGRDWGTDTSHLYNLDYPAVPQAPAVGSYEYERAQNLRNERMRQLGEDIGLALRARKERKRAEYHRRVESGGYLCEGLLAAISAGDEYSLNACLSVLLD